MSRCCWNLHRSAIQLSLARNGILGVLITVKIPQANAIIKRDHLTIGNQIRALQAANAPNNAAMAFEIADTAIASAQRAIRTAVHKSFGLSPGTFVFRRDMLLNIPTVVDLQQIIQELQRRRRSSYTRPQS